MARDQVLGSDGSNRTLELGWDGEVLALPVSSRLTEFAEPLRLELRVGRAAVGYGE
eukprot:COSAG05_NODE_193_length_14574_cov_23.070812_3_plen_56_part_00